jgi:hypothetical protein
MRLGRRRLVLSAAALAGALPARAQARRLERPRTVIALLQNMQRAADEGALLDEAFYGEANLKESFAGQQVAYGRPIQGYRSYGRVSGFGVLFESTRIGSDYREGGDFTFSLSSAEATPVEGRLQLAFLKPAVRFDVIENIFGKGWKPAAYPVAAGDAPPHAERAHGGTAIVYPSDGSNNSGRWIMFAFNPRAWLQLAVAAVR